jgi:hypothetical protein
MDDGGTVEKAPLALGLFMYISAQLKTAFPHDDSTARHRVSPSRVTD